MAGVFPKQPYGSVVLGIPWGSWNVYPRDEEGQPHHHSHFIDEEPSLRQMDDLLRVLKFGSDRAGLEPESAGGCHPTHTSDCCSVSCSLQASEVIQQPLPSRSQPQMSLTLQGWSCAHPTKRWLEWEV